MRLSVVIISKNSSSTLAECLASVSWADEIILLDSGSSDNTLEIAYTAGVKVFTNKNWLGYGIQRQRAQSFATGDYILMLDTDELVTNKLRQEIEKVLISYKSNLVYSIARRNFFLGKFIRYNIWYSDRVIRLYPRIFYQYSNDLVHESLLLKNASVSALNGYLLHKMCHNLINFKHKQKNYATAWAQQNHKYGKKVSIINILLHTINAFLRTLILHGTILSGRQGWILATINAKYTFIKYNELKTLNDNSLKE